MVFQSDTVLKTGSVGGALIQIARLGISVRLVLSKSHQIALVFVLTYMNGDRLCPHKNGYTAGRELCGYFGPPVLNVPNVISREALGTVPNIIITL